MHEPDDTGLQPRVRALILWADPDSPNLGVRVLASGTEALVHACWPDAAVTFHNYGSRRAHLPIGRLRSLLFERAFGRRGMQDWFRTFDVVIDTRSGDSFTDAYGLHRHAIMTAVGVFAAQAGVPVVLGPQTIGPFTTRRGRALARASLRSARAVFVRDAHSAVVAKRLGPKECIATTDVVFALPVPHISVRRDVLFNVSGLLWNPNSHVDHERYRALVRETCRRLTDAGRTVTLLAHVVHSGNADSDADTVRELAAELGLEAVIPSGLDHVRAEVASARVVIGSRMHACLNALSVGTPALPLAYSDKFHPLLADLGWPHGVDLRARAVTTEIVLAALADAERADVDVLLSRARAARHAGVFALARLARSPVHQ